MDTKRVIEGFFSLLNKIGIFIFLLNERAMFAILAWEFCCAINNIRLLFIVEWTILSGQNPIAKIKGYLFAFIGMTMCFW